MGIDLFPQGPDGGVGPVPLDSPGEDRPADQVLPGLGVRVAFEPAEFLLLEDVRPVAVPTCRGLPSSAPDFSEPLSGALPVGRAQAVVVQHLGLLARLPIIPRTAAGHLFVAHRRSPQSCVPARFRLSWYGALGADLPPVLGTRG